jgi:hypothetical protein
MLSFRFVVLTKYFDGQIRENEMSETYCLYGGEEKCLECVGAGKLSSGVT